MAGDAERVVARADELFAARRTWEVTWGDVAALYLPRRASDVARTTPGSPGTERLYNAVGVYATDLLAGALVSLLINPAMAWFALGALGVETRASQEYLARARDLMAQWFASRRAGFVPQAHEFFLDTVAFGTGVMFLGEREDGLPLYQTRPVTEVALDEDERGEVDTVYRVARTTGRRLNKEYGAGLDPAREYTVVHAVEPEGDGTWRSRHVLQSPPRVLREGRFKKFPYVVARWAKLSGEVYGRSPAINMLPEVRMLQRVSKVVIQSAQLAVNPPLLVPDDAFIAPVRNAPGATNVYRATAKNLVDKLPVGQVERGYELIAQREAIVLRAFYVDLLRALTARAGQTPLTATETVERVNEAMVGLTPIVVRLQQEMLAPVVSRTFEMLLKRGVLPDPPRELEGREFTVEFVSPATVAQRASEITSLARFAQSAALFLQMDPQSAKTVNVDAALRRLAKLLNVTPDVLRSEGEVRRMQRDAELAAVAAGVQGGVRDAGGAGSAPGPGEAGPPNAPV